MTRRGDRWLVWAIVASQFAPPFMFSGVAIALPGMGAELGMSAASLALVETLFLASATAFLMPSGRLADAGDRGTLFLLSLLTFAVLSLAIGASGAAWLVLSLRVLQGIASAMSSATGPALLVELVPPERRGTVFGAMLGTAYAGLALGPLGAGWIVSHWGWRAVFFTGGALILVGALPVLRQLPWRWRWPVGAVHGPSLQLLLGAAAGIVLGSARLTELHLSLPALMAGLAALLLFLRLQRHTTRPLLDLHELARNQVLRAALLVQLLLYLNAFCSIFLLNLFLQLTQRRPAIEAGWVLATGSLVMMLVAPIAGRLADRFAAHRVAACGTVAVAVSSLLGVLLDADSGPGAVIAILVLQGIGFGLFSSPNLAIIMHSLPPAQGSTASALAAQSRGLGMVLGMLTTGALIAIDYGQQPADAHPERFPGTLHAAYLVLLATSLVAMSIALRRPRPTAT